MSKYIYGEAKPQEWVGNGTNSVPILQGSSTFKMKAYDHEKVNDYHKQVADMRNAATARIKHMRRNGATSSAFKDAQELTIRQDSEVMIKALGRILDMEQYDGPYPTPDVHPSEFWSQELIKKFYEASQMPKVVYRKR